VFSYLLKAQLYIVNLTNIEFYFLQILLDKDLLESAPFLDILKQICNFNREFWFDFYFYFGLLFLLAFISWKLRNSLFRPLWWRHL